MPARFARLLAAVAAVTMTVLLGITGVASALTLPTLTQTQSDLKTTIAFAENTAATVQASTPAIQAAATAVQTEAQTFTAQLQAILAGAPADPEGASTALQGAISAEQTHLTSFALTQALLLTGKLGAPSCQILGAITALSPLSSSISIGVGGSPGSIGAGLNTLDRQTSDLLLQQYKDAYAKALAPLALPSGASALQPYLTLAQTLFTTLLKVNYHTDYLRPDGTSVVRDTPAILDVPMLLDVDGQTGFDVCAVTTLDLGTMTINQQISKLPTARSNMPLDIRAEFLAGLIWPGYSAKASQAPANFATVMPLTGSGAATQVQHPGARFDQTLGLTSAVQFRWETVGPDRNFDYKLAKTTLAAADGGGSVTNYTSSTRATSFTSRLVATLDLGSGPTPITASGNVISPAPNSLEICTTAKGYCSNAPAADKAEETASMHYLASEPTSYDSLLALVGTPANKPIVGSRLYAGAKAVAANGHSWIDTDNTSITGTSAAAIKGTFPDGFKADDRRGSWEGTAASNNPAKPKTGTISCPTGTTVGAGSFTLTGYACPFPASYTSPPTISGEALQGAVLTVNNSAWTPAPNAPSFTFTWKRCDADGNNCAVLDGVDGTSYTATADDVGHTLRATVKGVNVDGQATAETAPTAEITVPPLPENTAAPVITGSRKSATVHTVSKGTWKNAVTGYAYQWQICDAAGSGCADIDGATDATYTPGDGDQGHQIKGIVTATNVTGSSAAASVGLLIPGTPVNTALPVIKNGNAVVTDVEVVEGDKLTAAVGTWTDADSFTYQWRRCDAAGAGCADIAGATAATYTVGRDDIPVKVDGVRIAHTLRAVVTGANPNRTADATSPATGEALANDRPTRVEGEVNALLASDHATSYVGGSFDTVGPFAGGFGTISQDATSGPSTVLGTTGDTEGGDVLATLPDGAGGVYLGGSFTKVRGVACPSLAHINADKSLDAQFCNVGISGTVRALDRLGSSSAKKLIIAGGQFTIGGRNNLAFFDPATAATYFPTDGDPNGPVNAITNNASTSASGNVYYGGEFTAVGSAAKGNLSLVTVAQASGTPVISRSTNWAAAVCVMSGTACSATNTASVKQLSYSALALGGVFIVGKYTGIYRVGSTPTAAAPTPRGNGAYWISLTSNFGGWDPKANGTINTIGSIPTPATSALGSGGPYVIMLGGEFTTLNGLDIPFLGASGATSSAGSGSAGAAFNASPSTSFVPRPNGPVTSIASVGRATPADGTATIYVGGSFTQILGQARNRLAAINGVPALSTNAPTINTTWTPAAGSDVTSIRNDGSKLLIGGRFKVLGGSIRHNLAEVKEDGSLTAWAPAGTNGPVRALAAGDGSVYVGGQFTDAGAARSNIAAFSANLGGTTTFNPGVNGPVNALAYSGSKLYAGGAFSSAAGSSRSNAAAFGSDGTLAGWNPAPDGAVRAIAADGSVYLGGDFAALGATPRASLAEVKADGTITAFNPGTNGAVRSLALTGSSLYAGGAFGSIAGAPRGNLGEVSRTTGAATAWNPDADGGVNALLVNSNGVFAGGTFSAIGGAPRSRIAQLASGTGLATAYDPSADGVVNAIGTFGGAFAFGGAFTHLGTLPAPGLAVFPPA